ncbi:hypothetical protein [Hyphomicrobium sp. 2TAF46]|uniref:hypothetical protein n=1 Tax=Hyphomicrobium sp. 2TAF46 TaxID=3233019 RepID=UPI003F8EF4AC
MASEFVMVHKPETRASLNEVVANQKIGANEIEDVAQKIVCGLDPLARVKVRIEFSSVEVFDVRD